MTRVALLPSAYPPSVGGVEELTRHLALALVDAGDEVEVWTGNPDDREPETVEVRDGLVVRRFPMPLPAAKWASLSHSASIGPRTLFPPASRDAFRPDVLHVLCFGPNGAYATALARLTGLPLVVSLQGETVMDDADIFETSRVLRARSRRGLRAAAASPGARRSPWPTPSGDSAWPRQRRAWSRTGCDLDGPGSSDLVAGRRAQGPARHRRERPYVLALGRVVDKKGFDLLLEAYAAMDQSTGPPIWSSGARVRPSSASRPRPRSRASGTGCTSSGASAGTRWRGHGRRRALRHAQPPRAVRHRDPRRVAGRGGGGGHQPGRASGVRARRGGRGPGRSVRHRSRWPRCSGDSCPTTPGAGRWPGPAGPGWPSSRGRWWRSATGRSISVGPRRGRVRSRQPAGWRHERRGRPVRGRASAWISSGGRRGRLGGADGRPLPLPDLHPPRDRACAGGRPGRDPARSYARSPGRPVRGQGGRGEGAPTCRRATRVAEHRGTPDDGGWCELRLSGLAADLAAEAGISELSVSITHEAPVAAAVVVGWCRTRPSPDGEDDCR